MPGRPRRSCDNCNAQKLRCSGDRPACERCTRHRRPCIYTPTKRTGHIGRASPSRPSIGANVLDEILNTAVNGSIDGALNGALNGVANDAANGAATPVALPETAAVISAQEPSPSRLHVHETSVYGIPPNLLPPLLDLYFTHIYNSNLLFHRPSLVSAIESETIRRDVLLSICALAAKFYIDANGSPILVENGFCEQWAKEAGQFAFSQVETPSQDNIVVFLNLSLFWYSFGQFHKSGMHSSCAGNTAWILGLPPNVSSKESPLELEIRRRRFWGCYLFCGFLAGSQFPKIPTDEMLNASLPCSEGEFALSKPHAVISLRSGQSTQSIYGELVRAMALWSSVSKAIKQSDISFTTRLNDIQLLDRRIHEGRSLLCEYFPMDCDNMAFIPRTDLQRLLLVHIIYHQCLCSLHSSIVPLFSWSPCDDAFAYAQQLSAQTAYENANAISMLLETALDLDWDSRKMPSFIGYAAYCACAIQTPFLWCTKSEVRQLAVRGILANLKTLQILGSQWMFLNLLGKFAFALYKVYENAPFPLTDEPKGMSPESLKGFKPANSKARLSILGHNSIIVSDQGTVAAGTEEIGDLGLDGAESQHSRDIGNISNLSNMSDISLTAGGDANLTSLIVQISGQMRNMNGQLPIVMDPLFNSASSEIYGPEGSIGGSFSTDMPLVMDQCGYIKDWITELLQQDV